MERENLRRAAALSLLSLVLLLFAAGVTLMSGGIAAQERFETYWDPAQYTAALREAARYLRIVLAVDDLFILAYVGALGFAALGYSSEHRAAAVVAGVGAIALGALDFWENLTMGTSLEMAASGETIDSARIAHQAAISAAKWNAAAAALVALTFVIPKDRLSGWLLVWATRLVFPAATALFVTGAFDLREAARYAIYAGMLSGFVLLTIVTYGHSRDIYR